MGVGRDITHIALAVIGLALAGLLISRASQTATVAQSTAGAFGDVLRVATAQGASMGVGSAH